MSGMLRIIRMWLRNIGKDTLTSRSVDNRYVVMKMSMSRPVTGMSKGKSVELYQAQIGLMIAFAKYAPLNTENDAFS